MGIIYKPTKVLNCLAVLVFVSTLAVNDAVAQDDNPSRLLSMTELTIKGGHDTQFRDGVSAWKTCYLENDGEMEWNMWRRIQGEGIVYGMTSFMDLWAEMDESDEAGMACQSLAQSMIIPHVEKVVRNFARTLPEMSKSAAAPMEAISVYYWQVNNGAKFIDTVRSIQSAIRKVEGEPRSYWYSLVGGDINAPDYFVVTPYENFAAMDAPRDGVWTMVEKAEGKETRDQLQADMRDAIDKSWSFMFRRVGDLSHMN
jgi:hypothetical protein